MSESRKYQKPEVTIIVKTDLPKKVSLSNHTETEYLCLGEDFILTCLAIEEIEGQKIIVTQIGKITLNK